MQIDTQKNYLKEKWNQENLVGINSLTRRDGSVVIINITSIKIEDRMNYFCQPLCDTTIESIEKYDNDVWTEIQVFCRCSDPQTGNLYLGGEGGMGNEGFIVCLDDQEEPIWALFFQNSNPFHEIVLKENILEARSSLELSYSIDLRTPEKIRISDLG
jgi:hypothetical protein